MKEILDILVWIGFGFLLFVFLRGFNETQVKKHKDKLDEVEKRKQENLQKGKEV
jgi:hypothetical protein